MPRDSIDAAPSTGAGLGSVRTRPGSIPATIAMLNVVGNSAAFHEAMRRIARISGADAPVLIEGETGSGKEVAARAIHYLGPRRDKPFIPINCGAIPDSLIEAELFGHRRGAFTDAREPRAGVIAEANGGTLFLDEIDALSPKAQVTLLRFLQDLRYRPLGHSVEIACDVRIIAASNRPIEPLVAADLFRRDLLYRLNVLVLAIPALRDRQGDAELLAQHFFSKYAAKYGGAVKRLHPDTLRWIRAYDWPGNIRELENVIHRQVLLADGDEVRYQGASSRAGDAGADLDAPPDFRHAKAQAIVEFERRYLTRVLADARGNVSAAARMAGKERRAFARLLKKHGVDKGCYRA